MRILLLAALSVSITSCGIIKQQGEADVMSAGGGASACSGFKGYKKSLPIVWANYNLDQPNDPMMLGNVALSHTATPGCSERKISAPSNWSDYFGADIQLTSDTVKTAQYDIGGNKACINGVLKPDLDPKLKRTYWMKYLAGLAITPQIPPEVKIYAACQAKLELIRTQQVMESEKIDADTLSFLKREDAKAWKGIELIASFFPIEKVLSGAGYLVKLSSKGRITGGFAVNAASKLTKATGKMIGNLVAHLDELPHIKNMKVAFKEVAESCFSLDACDMFEHTVASLKNTIQHTTDKYTYLKATSSNVAWAKRTEGTAWNLLDDAAGGTAKAMELLEGVIRTAKEGREIAKGANFITKEYEMVEEGHHFFMAVKYSIGSGPMTVLETAIRGL